MKITLKQENLKNGLLITSRIIGNTNTLPILNNVLLKTDNGLLYISSTNLEIGLTTQVRCKIDEPGEVCIPAKIINDLIASLPQGNIEIESKGSEVEIKTGTYKTKIHSLPSEDFPKIPEIDRKESFNINGQELKKSIDDVVFAASTNETQPEISGVLLSVNQNEIKLVATDRYRLAEKTTTVNTGFSRDVIIPHRTVQEISRIIGGSEVEVSISLTETQILISLPETELVSRLVDGQYPPYQEIIPKETLSKIITNTNELSSALKTSGIFSRSNNTVTMEYDKDKGVIKLSSVSHDLGESVVDINAEIQGDSGVILFNPKYVVDALVNISDEQVLIRVIDDASPVLFSPNSGQDYLYLVMPIKN